MLRKINEINGYHGTSYNFDRFNHKKYLNTGDGSQSFGWGTYITDNEDIAEEYGARSMESNTGTYDKDGNRLTAEMLTNIANEVFSDANIIKDVVNKIRMSMYGKGALSEDDLIALKEEFVEKYPNMTDDIEQFFTILQDKSLRFVKANNYVYEVDIPDYDGSNYIMWLEKPNDQLLHRLEKGFEKLKRKYPSVNDLELENVESGRDIYTMLNDILGTPKAASLFLFNMCGIEGIIYPIGTIFGYEGEEGNNYVIFDANKVKIVNKEIMENKIRESENNVVYYGVFIDDESKGKLSSFIPDDAYKVFCDHMTIAFKTQFTEEIVSYCEEMLGEEVELTATHIGMTEDVIAVAVETECESLNNTKHITLCTLSPKGRPVQSNNITEWQPLPTPITLHGTVKAFPFNMTEDKKYVRQGIIPYGDGECCIGENEERLNEVEASDISLKSFEIQDDLNPKFWINNKLNSRIRLKLLDLADEFIDTLAVDWVKPEDIVLTGSIANYNWSKYSDVDVHILIDYKKVWKKTEFVQDYFDSKKELWTQEHGDLKIYGFPVEMYVEDTNADNPSSGVYSLNENKWIKEPNDFQDAELNENYIKRISAKIMTAIDNIEDKIKEEKDNHKLETSSEKLKKLFDKLHKQRQESLGKHGEMSTYNIIWKVLRRSGYLDKIWDIINNVYNKVNSIK